MSVSSNLSAQPVWGAYGSCVYGMSVWLCLSLFFVQCLLSLWILFWFCDSFVYVFSIQYVCVSWCLHPSLSSCFPPILIWMYSSLHGVAGFLGEDESWLCFCVIVCFCTWCLFGSGSFWTAGFVLDFFYLQKTS